MRIELRYGFILQILGYANRAIQNKWQGLISDTQYAIHRKVVEMVETLVISPAEGMHLIPHRLLREQRGGTTPPPTRLVHQQVVSYVRCKRSSPHSPCGTGLLVWGAQLSIGWKDNGHSKVDQGNYLHWTEKYQGTHLSVASIPDDLMDIMQGTDTSNKSDPNLWNYQVTFGDPVRKVGVNKFSPWVSAENFSAVAETRPPPDPR